MFKAALALSLLPFALSSPQYGGYGPAPGPTTPTAAASSAASSASSPALAANQMVVSPAALDPSSYFHKQCDLFSGSSRLERLRLLSFGHPGPSRNVGHFRVCLVRFIMPTR